MKDNGKCKTYSIGVGTKSQHHIYQSQPEFLSRNQEINLGLIKILFDQL